MALIPKSRRNKIHSTPPKSPENLNQAIKISEEFIQLRVLAKPNAKKSQYLGIQQDALAIALKAKPIDGKANQALIEFLSDYLNIPKTQIFLDKGEQSRIKLIKISNNQKNYLALEKIFKFSPS